MPRSGAGDQQVAEFLRGDPLAIGEVRDAVELVVRCFQFPDAGLNKDLVQDALTRILVSLSAGQFRNESSLTTYARRVARYTCLEHVRRRRSEVDLDPDALPSRDVLSGPEDSFLWTEEHLRNLEIFSRLPPECRRLMMMVFNDGLSYKEIARRLGATEGAVKTRVHRCRSAFRKAAGLVTPAASPQRCRKVGE